MTKTSKTSALTQILKALDLAADSQPVTLKAADFAQDRTKTTQRKPWTKYSARTHAKAVKNSVHQFGPAFGYAETDTAFMPSRDLFEKTGNPYPNTVKAEGNVVSDKYKSRLPFVLVQHAIWGMLATGEALSAQDIFANSGEVFADCEARAAEELGVKQVRFPKTGFDRNWFAYAILHTLRDLEATNALVLPLDAKRTSYTKWQMQEQVRTAIGQAEPAVEEAPAETA